MKTKTLNSPFSFVHSGRQIANSGSSFVNSRLGFVFFGLH